MQSRHAGKATHRHNDTQAQRDRTHRGMRHVDTKRHRGAHRHSEVQRQRKAEIYKVAGTLRGAETQEHEETLSGTGIHTEAHGYATTQRHRGTEGTQKHNTQHTSSNAHHTHSANLGV